MKKFIFLSGFFLAALGAGAQVTIGSGNVPSEWSLLDIDTSVQKKGLHSPRLDNEQRETLIPSGTANVPAEGSLIFNTTTKCLEYWNSKEWVSLCEGDEPPLPPTIVPPYTGGDTWAKTQWVGAFWRNHQTGERIIRANNNGSAWSVSVDEPYRSWIVVDYFRGENATLWKAGITPDDAESYQLNSGVSELDGGTGAIFFRIGLKSANPTPATPRYGIVTLTVGGTPYKLFMRQGEAADYVFGKSDLISGGTGDGSPRTLAAKFSPYNLTAPNLTDAVQYADIAARGGEFVKFPTQAGAFFQWAAPAGYERRAYHPSNPTSALTGNWTSSYASGNWDGLNGLTIHETCPSGWRRPTVGATNDTHTTQAASGSELMQSLFHTTFDSNINNTNSTNHRYFGYYADGFFDRRPIETQGGVFPRSNAVVSKNTKDVAYSGLLFTNPSTNASLFVPASGFRHRSAGSLYDAGNVGYAWSSSAYDSSYGWYLGVGSDNAYQSIYGNRNSGHSVRCMTE